MPLASTAASNYTAEYTTTNIPAFLSKLWTLVEDSKYDELIAWDPSGFSFHVFDQTRFSREILPRFFKHNNMASFIRQLNMYGFRKVNSIDHGSLKSEKDDMEFHHPYFIKGKEQFLEFIKRKVPDIKPGQNQQHQQQNQQQQQQQQQHLQGSNVQQALATTNQQQALSLQFPPIKSDDLNKVLEDVNVIKSKQKMVDDSLFNVKKENEALWKEIALLRQKHHHQQQIVNKLIHFLVHLVNPSNLGIKRTRPLMIDSHSTASFINADDDDQINEIENDEDEEFVLTSSDTNLNPNANAENLNSPSNKFIFTSNQNNNNSSSSSSNMSMNNQYQKQKYQSGRMVELVDDEEDININSNGALHESINSSDKRKSDYVDDVGEIETINLVKSNSNNSNIESTKISNADRDNSAFNSSSKKIKLMENVSSSNINSSEPVKTPAANFIYTNNNNSSISNGNSIIDLNNHKSNSTQPTLNTPDQEFLDPNLFLNTSAEPSVLIQDALSSEPSPHMSTNAPIITLPNSPILTNNSNTNQISTIQDLTPVATNNSTDLMQQQNASNNLRRTISSSSHMSDHIEALQLDLNSIKEYLSNSQFGQIDSYTINNLFSPIILDPIDNEQFYMEQPLGGANQDLNISSNNNIEYNVETPPSNNQNTNGNNGKIIGNEVIQYDSFHSSDIFDEIFSNDAIKVKSNLATPDIQKSINQAPRNNSDELAQGLNGSSFIQDGKIDQKL